MKLKDFEKMTTSLNALYFIESEDGRLLKIIDKDFEHPQYKGAYMDAVLELEEYFKTDAEVTHIFNNTDERRLDVTVVVK